MVKLYIFLFLFWSSSLIAEEVRQTFESVRANGRGGTYVAVYDSDEASRLNPATLAESNISFQLRYGQLDVFVGQNTLETITDVISGLSEGSIFGVLQKLDNKWGERQLGQGQLSLFAMRFGGFEISPFFYNRSYLEMRTPAVPEAAFEVDTMAGINFSYGWEITKTLKLGVSLRPTHRWYSATRMSLVDVTSIISNTEGTSALGLVYGFGLGVDLGVIYAPEKNFRLGLTIHHLGDMEYFQDYGSEPPQIWQKIALGLLKRWELNSLHWDFMLDVYGPINREGVNLLRTVRLGTEVGTDIFTRDNDLGVTFGFRDGYFSAGAYFDLFLIRFDVANYAVELGELPGQRVDRRWGFSARVTSTF